MLDTAPTVLLYEDMLNGNVEMLVTVSYDIFDYSVPSANRRMNVIGYGLVDDGLFIFVINN